MPYEYYPITGIQTGKGPDGSIPARQEIDDWYDKAENAKQVNLYLLALRRLQDIPPNLRDSWFQIAGIHGMPYKGWDEPKLTNEETKDKGYCTHANPLFPPWHRPYLLLLEQQIYEIMINDIVPYFPESERGLWKQAADTWRLPYWDWAVHAKVPKLCEPKTVTVQMPHGVLTTIENPLYQFTMPNDKPMSSEGVGTIKDDDSKISLAYGNCFGTSRCPEPADMEPTSNAWKEGIVNNDRVAKLMASHIALNDKNYGPTAEMVYRLLTYPLSYDEFASVSLPENASKVQTDVNLEFIHNNIHYWAGGDGGHMSQIPVATFDPIFWLHHCNIDRIFAIWQVLNPDKWITEAKQAEFAQKVIGLPQSQNVTNRTPLRPFHKDKQGTVWTPDGVRDHLTLGYTYPEIQPWKPEFKTNGTLDIEKYIKSLKTTINSKYGQCRAQALDILHEGLQNISGSAPAIAIAIATTENTHKPAIAISRARASGGGGSAIPAGPRGTPDSSSVPVPRGMKLVPGGDAIESNDFAISVRFSRFALQGHPFNIKLCLAPLDSSQARNPEQDYIGSVYNFSGPANIDGREVCSNCTNLQREKVKITSYLLVNALLNKLVKDDKLGSLEKEEVTHALRRLYWRVYKYGKEVPEDKLSNLDLDIIVSINTATHHDDPGISSSFENFIVIPSLGCSSNNNSNTLGDSSSGPGGEHGPGAGVSQDQTKIPSDVQYLAIDKTIKLNNEVPSNGTITVQSTAIDLHRTNVRNDSTGISFMYFDESSGKDKRDENNYDVLLSISIRRPEGILRLNSKPASGAWHRQNDLSLHNNWFSTLTPEIKVREDENNYDVYIDGTCVGSRVKKFQGKNITHVQYWVTDDDQTTSALSYALTVKVG